MGLMEGKVMKKSLLFFAAVTALSLLASCAREDYAPAGSDNAAGNVQTLTACFAPGETKTAFVGGTYMWKTNDNIVVRSSNANGYSTFKYTGDDTNGEAIFTNTSEDVITYGQNSFAIYPAKTSGSGDSAYPKEEGGSLKPVLKDTYTWFDGNVEAPMLARVESGTPLEFKHLGGCLKVTYKNVPPKATKIMVYAPVVDADLLAAGKVSYKIHSIMNQTYNWTTAGGGFDPVEIPYVKAYDHSGTYELTVNISSATAVQRTSDDGITAYIPLPVGPVEVDSKNVYPQLKIWLAFADGTEVPGSLRTATNVQIERAHIKPMPAISLTKYTTETIISGLARTPHDIIRLSDEEFVVTGEQYHVYFLDVNAKTATQSAVNGESKYPAYPYGVCYAGGDLYIANKVGSSQNGIYKYDMTTKIYSIIASGYNQPMQIKEHNGSVYLLCRGDGSAAGKVYVFPSGVPGAVASEVYADFSGIASTGYAWPLSFAFDTDGSMVVAVSASSGTPSECFKLYKVASKGATPVALFGSGTKPGNYAAMADGASAAASFAPDIQDIEFDGSGNLYIADQYALRKLVRGTLGLEDGTIVTVTESGVLPRVDGLALDSTYSHIYVSNKTNKCIYKITIE